MLSRGGCCCTRSAICRSRNQFRSGYNPFGSQVQVSCNLIKGNSQKRMYPKYNSDRELVLMAISDRSAPIFTRFWPKTTECSRFFLLCSTYTRCWPFYVPLRWATRLNQHGPREQLSQFFRPCEVEIDKKTTLNNKQTNTPTWTTRTITQNQISTERYR